MGNNKVGQYWYLAVHHIALPIFSRRAFPSRIGPNLFVRFSTSVLHVAKILTADKIAVCCQLRI